MGMPYEEHDVMADFQEFMAAEVIALDVLSKRAQQRWLDTCETASDELQMTVIQIENQAE